MADGTTSRNENVTKGERDRDNCREIERERERCREIAVLFADVCDCVLCCNGANLNAESLV